MYNFIKYEPIKISRKKTTATDFVMVFVRKYCKVKSKKIKKKYKGFYKFSEYDGKETVEIDYHRYDLVSILLDDTMTDSEKINKLKERFTRPVLIHF